MGMRGNALDGLGASIMTKYFNKAEFVSMPLDGLSLSKAKKAKKKHYLCFNALTRAKPISKYAQKLKSMSINKRICATVIIHWLDRMNLSREGHAMRSDDDGQAPFMRRKATADACPADKLPVGVPHSKSVPRQGAGANTRPTPRLWDG